MTKQNQQMYKILSVGLLLCTVLFAVLYIRERSSYDDTISQPVIQNDSVSTESVTVAEETVVTNLDAVDESDIVDVEEEIASVPESELSQEEIDGLLLMREEEKLARDVYITLYEQWGQNIFSNISESEQTHTDAVKQLLDKYALEDPVTDDTVGAFTYATMQQLYDDLTEQGSASLTAALTVGATVEDLDINDLENLMAQTDKEDILTVYQNLQKGSRNHLRSFTRVLERNGENYEAQYISDEAYNDIVTSPSENGVKLDAEGNAAAVSGNGHGGGNSNGGGNGNGQGQGAY